MKEHETCLIILEWAYKVTKDCSQLEKAKRSLPVISEWEFEFWSISKIWKFKRTKLAESNLFILTILLMILCYNTYWKSNTVLHDFIFLFRFRFYLYPRVKLDKYKIIWVIERGFRLLSKFSILNVWPNETKTYEWTNEWDQFVKSSIFY